jgi:deoxyribonuclease V
MEHRFDVSPKEAVQLQQELRKQVRLTPITDEIEFIGGCDVSMNRFAKEGFAGFITLSTTLEPVAESVVKDTIPFPYVPGLLSFREIPMLLKAWEKLSIKPDVLVVDGIGIAHPRRFGIASHFGVLLDIPTIGCAKSVLTGIYEEPENEPGAHTDLVDRKTGEVIGAALRTKRNVKPVFISPGHRITLSEAVDLITSCVRKHRLPEPTRLAHNLVNAYRIKDAVR